MTCANDGSRRELSGSSIRYEKGALCVELLPFHCKSRNFVPLLYIMFWYKCIQPLTRLPVATKQKHEQTMYNNYLFSNKNSTWSTTANIQVATRIREHVGVLHMLKDRKKSVIWQFTFCWWPKPDVFIFFYTWLPHAFPIMKSMDKYDSYNSSDRSNVEIWMKYYEVCLILSFHYRKSLNTACFKKDKTNMFWYVAFYRKSHFWNDLGKVSILFHMIKYDF